MLASSTKQSIRWLLCSTLIGFLGLCVLTAGCPGTTDNGDGNTDPNAVDNGDNTDPNSTNNGGNTDPNSTDNGNTDPNTSGNGGTTDPNSSNNNGGNTDPNTSGNGGSTVPDPATSITLTQIARTGTTQVPGQANGVTFTGFGSPVIDAKGRIAFWATYAGTGAVGGAGLYVWDGALNLVVCDDPNSAGIVPNRPTPSYFGKKGTDFKPLDQGIVWGAGDRLLFASEVVGSGAGGDTGTRGLYRWRATDSNIVRIADREQVLTFFPDTFSNGFDQSFSLPGVGDAGQAVFGIAYTYITSGSSPTFVTGQGIFTSNGTTISMLVDSVHSANTPGGVPDQDSDVYFVTIAPSTAISPNGDILFQSKYTSESGVSGRGVYLARSGTIYRVIDSRSNTAWPGLTSGAKIGTNQYQIAIGSEGHIAVDTTLTVSGSTRDAVLLWDWDAGTWTELTGTSGAAATALLSGVNADGQVVILAGGNPYLVNRTTRTRLNATLPSDLASATLTWANTGGSINNYGRAVLPFSYAEDGSPGLVLWTGAQMLVIADAKLGTPTGLTAISTVSTPERDRPGRSGILNDDDEAVFRATLSGSVQAIYLATGN